MNSFALERLSCNLEHGHEPKKDLGVRMQVYPFPSNPNGARADSGAAPGARCGQRSRKCQAASLFYWGSPFHVV